MKNFVEYLLKEIVTNPDAVVVDEITTDDGTEIQITVAQEDMGLVIGKEGRTIKSIRTLAKTKAIKENLRVNVELLDPYKTTEGTEEVTE